MDLCCGLNRTKNLDKPLNTSNLDNSFNSCNNLDNSSICKEKNLDIDIDINNIKNHIDNNLDNITVDDIELAQAMLPLSVIKTRVVDLDSSEINIESHMQKDTKTEEKLAALAVKKLQEDYEVFKMYHGVESNMETSKRKISLESDKKLIRTNIKDEYLSPIIPKLIEERGQNIPIIMPEENEDKTKYYDLCFNIDKIDICNRIRCEDNHKMLNSCYTPIIEILVVSENIEQVVQVRGVYDRSKIWNHKENSIENQIYKESVKNNIKDCCNFNKVS